MAQSSIPQALEDKAIIPAQSADSDVTILLEPCPKRVRAVVANVPIIDSRRVMLLFETRHLPVYYFPIEDVRMDLLQPTDRHTHCPYKGDASYWSIKVGDRVVENAVWGYPNPIPGCPDISGYVAVYWNKMDAWFEEDDEVFVHPRDPYHRVDVLNSSRHVRIVIAGETVAESHRPRLLFETHLPTRYYMPKLDVRMDLLGPSETTTSCPYKGDAGYYSVQVGDTLKRDIAWYYRHPYLECARIEYLICFFNERVDALYVDGELQPKPVTPWSK